MLALVALAGTGLWQFYHSNTVPTFDELFRMWLARFPVAAALIWLAMHASNESALAKRLEEDYGYKAAIATCFEGFRKEMSTIEKDVASDSALGKLCGDTLTTIATPPGRIYDKHPMIVSPIHEAGELIKIATEAGKVAAEASKTATEVAKPLIEVAAKAVKPV